MPNSDDELRAEIARIEHACRLGRAAFKAGKPRVPALDADLKPLLAMSTVIGASIPLLDAWIDAWTQASLAAPIPGWTDEENAALQRARNGL